MPVETLTQLIRVNTTLLHRYSQVVYNHRPAGCLLTNPVGGRIGLRATYFRVVLRFARHTSTRGFAGRLKHPMTACEFS